MRQYLYVSLVCFALTGVLLVVCGCGINRNIPNAPWQSAYDAPWAKTISCYQKLGYDTSKVKVPVVEVRSDCHKDASSAYQWFHLNPSRETGASAYGWVHGGYISVCPDLAALQHEFSHWVSLTVRGMDPHDGVCGL